MTFNDEYMSLVQAQRFLHIDARELNQWLSSAHITPIQYGRAAAQQFILRADVARLATTHGIISNTAQADQQKLLVSPALADYGPFTRDTLVFLESGARIANKALLSGPHIILATLRQPAAVNIIRGTPQYADLRDFLFLRVERLATQLERWIDMPAIVGQGELITFGLTSALSKAREAAGSKQIEWYTLLRSIVAHDRDIETIRASFDIDLNAHMPFVPAYTPTPTNSYVTDHNLSIGLHSPYVPTRCEPTASLRYAKRHHVAMDDMENELSERTPGQVIVVRGLSGSPRDRLAHVLADKLANPPGSPDGMNLPSLRHVVIQDVGHLYAAGANGIDEPVAALHESIRIASALRAVSILSRGEQLASTGEILNMRLLGALAAAFDIPIIISYEDVDDASAARPIALQFIDYRLVEMDSYDSANTANAIHDYYDSRMEALGLIVDKGALDTIMFLESAIFVHSNGKHKRKVLPYSVADLIVSAQKTLVKELRQVGSVRALALTAKGHAETLINDLNQGRLLLTAIDKLDAVLQRHQDDEALTYDGDKLRKKWATIWSCIEAIPDRMATLASSSVPTTDDGIKMITDDLVVAELFGPKWYKMDLWAAFTNDVRLSDPRLRDFLEDEEA